MSRRNVRVADVSQTTEVEVAERLVVSLIIVADEVVGLQDAVLLGELGKLASEILALLSGNLGSLWVSTKLDYITYSRQGSALAADVHEKSCNLVQAKALILVLVVFVKDLATTVSPGSGRWILHFDKRFFGKRELFLDVGSELAPFIVVTVVSCAALEAHILLSLL